MQRSIGIASLLLFILALLLPAALLVPLDPDPRFPPFHQPGFWFLLGGWRAHVSWWANVSILVVGLSLATGDHKRVWPSLISVALALSSFLYVGTPFALEHGDWRIDHFTIGYWVWLAAAAAPLSLVPLAALDRRRDARLAPGRGDL